MENGTEADAARPDEPRLPDIQRASWSPLGMALGIAGVVLALLLVVLVLLPPEINGGPPPAFVNEQRLRICAQHVVHAVIKGAAVDTLIPLVEGQVDLWDNQLRMRVEGSVLQIESRGEDGAWGTSDDLVEKQVLPR